MKKINVLILLCFLIGNNAFSYNVDLISEDELRLDCKSAQNPIFGHRLTYVLGIDWLNQNSANGLKNMDSRPTVYLADEPYAITGLVHPENHYSVQIEIPMDLENLEVGQKTQMIAYFPRHFSDKTKKVLLNCKLVQFKLPKELF